MTDTVIDAPAPAAAPAAAPTPAAPAAQAPAAPAPAPAAKAPSPAPAAEPAPVPPPDKAEWRARAIAEVFGEEKDTDTPEAKTEREKLGKLAGRYNTMGDALKALREAQRRISSGELKAPLPKDAKPEQIAEWRKENGIPEDPSKYDLTMPDGLVIGDNDKPLVDGFVKDMHGLNATPDVVKGAVASYLKLREAQIEKFQEDDALAKSTAEDALRADWGNDYRQNVAGIESMLGQADASVANAIVTARLPDGTSLANNPQVLKWLAGHARELGYVGATVVPAGGDIGKGMDEEIASIEKSMFNEDGTKNKAYWGSDKAQARYSSLLEAKQRREKK